MAQLRQWGIRSIFVLTPECFPDDGRTWEEWTTWYVTTYRPDVVLIGNEPDAYIYTAEHDSSWVVGPDQYRLLWDRLAPAVQRAGTGALMGIGGQMGWDGQWLRELCFGWRPQGATYVALHCYPDPFDLYQVQSTQRAIKLLEELTELKVIITEWTVADWCMVDWLEMVKRRCDYSTIYSWGDGAGHMIAKYVESNGVADWEWLPTAYLLAGCLRDASYRWEQRPELRR